MYNATHKSETTFVSTISPPSEARGGYGTASIAKTVPLLATKYFESGKNGIANYFKSLGHDRDYQFRYYPVGTVPGHEDELCVKVWNWDNRWKVEYYEDGKLKGEMKQYKGMDPDYDFFLQRKAVTEGKDMKERGRQANKNAYFFFSTKPSDKAKKIKIVVTDANGKSYEQSLEH